MSSSDAILLIPLLWVVAKDLVLGTKTIWFILHNELIRTSQIRSCLRHMRINTKGWTLKSIDLWFLLDPLPLPFFSIYTAWCCRVSADVLIVLVLICLACQKSVRQQLDEGQSQVKMTVNQLSPKLSGIHSWPAASLCVLSSTHLAQDKKKTWIDICECYPI